MDGAKKYSPPSMGRTGRAPTAGSPWSAVNGMPPRKGSGPRVALCPMMASIPEPGWTKSSHVDPALLRRTRTGPRCSSRSRRTAGRAPRRSSPHSASLSSHLRPEGDAAAHHAVGLGERLGGLDVVARRAHVVPDVVARIGLADVRRPRTEQALPVAVELEVERPGVPSATAGSSACGALISGAPLFHRPTSWAPSRSADGSPPRRAVIVGAGSTQPPSPTASNSGTFCSSRRNTRNAPLRVKSVSGSCGAPGLVIPGLRPAGTADLAGVAEEELAGPQQVAARLGLVGIGPDRRVERHCPAATGHARRAGRRHRRSRSARAPRPDPVARVPVCVTASDQPLAAAGAVGA